MNNKYNIKFSTYKTDLLKEIGIDTLGVLRRFYEEKEFPAIIIKEYEEYKILATIVNDEIMSLVVPSDHKEVKIETLLFEHGSENVYKLIEFYFYNLKREENE
jgi:hypothetical protein